MRERLTAAFVAITLLMLLGAAFVRSYAVTGELRERESKILAIALPFFDENEADQHPSKVGKMCNIVPRTIAKGHPEFYCPVSDHEVFRFNRNRGEKQHEFCIGKQHPESQ